MVQHTQPSSEEDRLFIGASEEMMVEAYLSELVDKYGRLRHRGFREHPRKEGRLAAPEEARNDRDRSLPRFTLSFAVADTADALRSSASRSSASRSFACKCRVERVERASGELLGCGPQGAEVLY